MSRIKDRSIFPSADEAELDPLAHIQLADLLQHRDSLLLTGIKFIYHVLRISCQQPHLVAMRSPF